jgi:hypothetical protein
MQKHTIIERNQPAIDSAERQIETAVEMLQQMIEQVSELEINLTAENWVNVLRNPEKATIEMLTADLTIEKVGRFNRKRSATIAELDLPDLTDIIRTASNLSGFLKLNTLPLTILTIAEGQAIRNDAEFQAIVDGFTVYASDPVLWERMLAVQNAINDFNKLADARNLSPIMPNANRPFHGWFNIEPDGQVKISAERYKLMKER